jgi:DNA end-binding protein Ku
MAEAVWNGFLRLSLVSCPVRLAPASSEAHVIRLDQLNSRTGNPVTQQFVDSRTGDVVAANAVVRGYRGEGAGDAAGHVTISDEEYEALSAETRNIIEVAHFSPSGRVDRARLETSYYIYPDGGLAPDTLDALRLAMRRGGHDAIAYVRLGERERMVLIQLHGTGLMLSTLRPPRALEPAEFAERAERDVPPEMVEIAETIIARRVLEGDPNALHDRYESRLRGLIAQKAGGGVSLPPEPAAASVASPPPVQAASAATLAPPPIPEPAPPPPPPAPPPPVAAAAMPQPEPEPPAPQSEPEPEPVVDTTPAPEGEPEGSVLAGAPDLEPVAVTPPPEPIPSPVPQPEPEGSVLSGEPAPKPVPAPEPERAAVEPPRPEPERQAEPAAAAPAAAEAAAPEDATPPAEAESAPAEAAASPSDAAALARAEQRVFGGDQQAKELGTEILLHIMGLGDRRFVEPGWAGHPGSRRQIEAMSIRPREELESSAIEFRVFAQEGRATAWVSNGNYAGTRGRQLPLTGFAVRPAPELRDRFDIVYEGCFFDGGVVGPKRNGEICTSPVANDPLEAVRVSIVERDGGSPH